MKTPITGRVALALCTAGLLASAHAQSDKPIRLIVPLTTGSTVDAMARAMSATMAEVTGHAVVVENLPTGPLTTDLLGGQVDMAFVSVTAVAPHIKAGKLRAIAMSSAQRTALLPDVPTLAESGLPRYGFDAWIALVGPAGLPPAVVQKTAADLKAVLAHKEVADALAGQGIVLIHNTPEQALPFFKAELDKHLKLVKLSGASVD